jgi:hypothetical protein
MVSKHAKVLQTAAGCASGTTMADDTDRDEGRAASRVKDSRQDRLKLALRENLKRRKMQARERGKTTDMPSSDHEAHPDGELGKRAD